MKDENQQLERPVSPWFMPLEDLQKRNAARVPVVPARQLTTHDRRAMRTAAILFGGKKP